MLTFLGPVIRVELVAGRQLLGVGPGRTTLGKEELREPPERPCSLATAAGACERIFQERAADRTAVPERKTGAAHLKSSKSSLRLPAQSILVPAAGDSVWAILASLQRPPRCCCASFVSPYRSSLRRISIRTCRSSKSFKTYKIHCGGDVPPFFSLRRSQELGSSAILMQSQRT